MPTPFIKTEGAGNDLILLDMRARSIEDPAKLAVAMCDRHVGVGADGLLTIETGPDALPFVRMFNPDGTEDFCGNGMRCVAAWLHHDAGGSGEPIRVRTPRGDHEARVTPTGPRAFEVDIQLVIPTFQPDAIPVSLPGSQVLTHPLDIDGRAWPISCVSTGTAHTAIFLDQDVDDETFLRVSPLIENHAIFSERTTVLWCRAERPDRIHMRIWERGVGETFACGTGTCAALVIGRALGHTGDRAEIVTRGGAMSAEWHGSGLVRLIGPARIIYEGLWEPQ